MATNFDPRVLEELILTTAKRSGRTLASTVEQMVQLLGLDEEVVDAAWAIVDKHEAYV